MGVPPKGSIERQLALGSDEEREAKAKRRIRPSSQLAELLAHRRRKGQTAVEQVAVDAQAAASQAGVEIPAQQKAEMQAEAQEASKAELTLQQRVANAKAELRKMIKAKQREVDSLRDEADGLTGFSLSGSRRERGKKAVAAAEQAEAELDALYEKSGGESESTGLAKKQLRKLRGSRKDRAKAYIKSDKSRSTRERVDRRATGKASMWDKFKDFPGRMSGSAYAEWVEAWEDEDKELVVKKQYEATVAEVVGENHIAKLDEHIALASENVAERNAQDDSFYTRYYDTVGKMNLEQLLDWQAEGDVAKFIARSMTFDRIVKAKLVATVASGALATGGIAGVAGMLGMRGANAYMMAQRMQRTQKRGQLRGMADRLMTQENTNAGRFERAMAGAGKMVSELIRRLKNQPEQVQKTMEEMSEEELLANIGDLLAWSEMSGTRIGANVFNRHKSFGGDELRQLTTADVLDSLLEQYGQRLEAARTPEQVEGIATELDAALDRQNIDIDAALDSRLEGAQDRLRAIEKTSNRMGAAFGFFLPNLVRAGTYGSMYLLSGMSSVAEAQDHVPDGLISKPIEGDAPRVPQRALEFDRNVQLMEGSQAVGGMVDRATGIEVHTGTSELRALQNLGLQHVEGYTFRDLNTGETFDVPVMTRAEAADNPGLLPTADIVIQVKRIDGVDYPVIKMFDTSGRMQMAIHSDRTAEDAPALHEYAGRMREIIQAAANDYPLMARANAERYMDGRVPDALNNAYGDVRADVQAGADVHELAEGDVLEHEMSFVTVRIAKEDFGKLQEAGYVGANENGALIFRDSAGVESPLNFPLVDADVAERNPHYAQSDEVVLTISDGTLVAMVYDVNGDLQLAARGDSFPELYHNLLDAHYYEDLDQAGSVQLDDGPGARAAAARVMQQAREPKQFIGGPRPGLRVPRSAAPEGPQPVFANAAAVEAAASSSPAEGLGEAYKYDAQTVLAMLQEMADHPDTTVVVGDSEMTYRNFSIGDTPVRAEWAPESAGFDRQLWMRIGSERLEVHEDNLDDIVETIQGLAKAENPPVETVDFNGFEPAAGADYIHGEPPRSELQARFKEYAAAIGEALGDERSSNFEQGTDMIPPHLLRPGANADMHVLINKADLYGRLGLTDATSLDDKVVGVDGKKVRVGKLFTDAELQFVRRLNQFAEEVGPEGMGNPEQVIANYAAWLERAQGDYALPLDINSSVSGMSVKDMVAGVPGLSGTERRQYISTLNDYVSRLEAAGITLEEARLMNDVDYYLGGVRKSYMPPAELERFLEHGSQNASYRARKVTELLEEMGYEARGADGRRAITLSFTDELTGNVSWIQFFEGVDGDPHVYGVVNGQEIRTFDQIPRGLGRFTLETYHDPLAGPDQAGLAPQGPNAERAFQDMQYDPNDPDSYRSDVPRRQPSGAPDPRLGLMQSPAAVQAREAAQNPDQFRPRPGVDEYKGDPLLDGRGYNVDADTRDAEAARLARRTRNPRALERHMQDMAGRDNFDNYQRADTLPRIQDLPPDARMAELERQRGEVGLFKPVGGEVARIREAERVAAQAQAAQLERDRQLARLSEQPIRLAETRAGDASIRAERVAEMRRDDGTSWIEMSAAGEIPMYGWEYDADKDEEVWVQTGTMPGRATGVRFEPRGRNSFRIRLEGGWDSVIEREVIDELLADNWEQIVRDDILNDVGDSRVVGVTSNYLSEARMPEEGIQERLDQIREDVYTLAKLYEVKQDMIRSGLDREPNADLLQRTPPAIRLETTKEFETVEKAIRQMERKVKKYGNVFTGNYDQIGEYRRMTSDLPRVPRATDR